MHIKLDRIRSVPFPAHICQMVIFHEILLLIEYREKNRITDLNVVPQPMMPIVVPISNCSLHKQRPCQSTLMLKSQLS